MSGATVSFHVGTSTSLSHNNRENIYGNPDIDSTKTHENICYVREDIKKIYSENFDEAVRDYNETQKRSDRKINDYYKKILHDKKTEHQREIIVAIGRVDDDIDKDFKKEMLDHYMKGFQERNPNLKVYNAVMHLDEANPHLHINYVPVYETSRGLKKRVGQNKAIEQQGFKTFEEWRGSETDVLEKLMSARAIEREYKGSHNYMKVSEYKKYAESLNTLKNEINSFEEVKKEIKHEVEVEKKVRDGIQSEIKAFREDLNALESFNSHHTPKIVLGRVSEREYRDLKDTALKILSDNRRLKENLEKVTRDRTIYKSRLESYKSKMTKIEKANHELLQENKQLKKEISVYEIFLDKLNLKEVFKDFVSTLKQMKQMIKTKTQDWER